jgi:hypothetical protein
VEKNISIRYNTNGMAKFKRQTRNNRAARAGRVLCVFVPLRLKKERTMKKSILTMVFVLVFGCTIFLSTTAVTAQDCIKLLKIQEPTGSKAKNRLLFNVEQVKAIVDAMNLKAVSASIELVDNTENVLAELAKIKGGTIKWGHKIVDGSSLLVKLKSEHHGFLLEKIKENSQNPGLRILASDVSKAGRTETRVTIGSCHVTFAEFADLVVTMKYPFNGSPGQALGKDISLTIENKGTVPAENFDVQMVLSGDTDIPVEPVTYAEEFKDNILLEQGKETVAALQPGERAALSFKGSLKVPPGTAPGRYYLGAVVDAGDKIKELNEKNNIDTRLFIVSLPEPKLVILELPDTQLVYEPAKFGLNIVSHGYLLSNGADWRKCNIKPYVFQIKHAAWEDFHWEVNTLERGVWQLTGAKYCKTGGKAREMKLEMNIKGGSRAVPPSRVVLKLMDARLEYEPTAQKFRVLTNENQIQYIPYWQVIKLKSHLYHVRFRLWTEDFWELDAFKKEVRKITGGTIGQEGGTAEPLDITLKVEQ